MSPFARHRHRTGLLDALRVPDAARRPARAPPESRQRGRLADRRANQQIRRLAQVVPAVEAGQPVPLPQGAGVAVPVRRPSNLRAWIGRGYASMIAATIRTASARYSSSVLAPRVIASSNAAQFDEFIFFNVASSRRELDGIELNCKLSASRGAKQSDLSRTRL